MAKIFLFAKSPNYGAAPLIAKAIQDHTEYDVIQSYSVPDPLGFHKYAKDAIYLGKYLDEQSGVSLVNSADHLIFVGAASYNRFWENLAPKAKSWKSAAVILTDSGYYRLAPWYNESFKRRSVTVYAMPDLFVHAKEVGAIPFYPPVDASGIQASKAEGVRLGHATRSPGKKGSDFIRRVFSQIMSLNKNVHSDIIQGLTWEENLRRKAKCHIFVDQLIKDNPDVSQARWVGKSSDNKPTGNRKYYGGLGKSGLEAMALKCLTLTSGNEWDTSPYFPPPPVVWVSWRNLKDTLKNLIRDTQERKRITSEQFAWVNQYASLSFVGPHVTRHITGV